MVAKNLNQHKKGKPSKKKTNHNKGRKNMDSGSGPARFKILPQPPQMTISVSRRRPRFTRTLDGFRVCGTEKIQIIQGSGSGLVSITQLQINPGLVSAFPELSQFATSFERYRMFGLKFYVVPRKGTNVSGVVLLAPQYDAADPVPTSELQVAQYRGVKEIMLADTSGHMETRLMTAYPKAPTNLDLGTSKYLFTRPGALANNLDEKTYDAMSLAICVSDSNTGNVADLWIEYDVELAEIQPSSSLGSTGTIVGVPVSSANMFGTTVVNQTSSSILPVSASVNTITFANAGEYFVSLQTIGTGISALGTSTTTGSGITISAGAAAVGAAATDGRITFIIRTTSPSQTLVLTCTATTLTTCVATILLGNYSNLLASGNY